MNHGVRSVLVATLPAALVFAACQGRSGLSGENPDSGTPVSPNPDADKTGPVTPNPDTAIRPADATPGNLDLKKEALRFAQAVAANL